MYVFKVLLSNYSENVTPERLELPLGRVETYCIIQLCYEAIHFYFSLFITANGNIKTILVNHTHPTVLLCASDVYGSLNLCAALRRLLSHSYA